MQSVPRSVAVVANGTFHGLVPVGCRLGAPPAFLVPPILILGRRVSILPLEGGCCRGPPLRVCASVWGQEWVPPGLRAHPRKVPDFLKDCRLHRIK